MFRASTSYDETSFPKYFKYIELYLAANAKIMPWGGGKIILRNTVLLGDFFVGIFKLCKVLRGR